MKNIIVLIGKSASGKDTEMKSLEKIYGVKRLVSTTTRPPRPNEVDGFDYHFVSTKEFELNIDDFVEYRTYDTVQGVWYYGLHKKEIDNLNGCGIVILDMDGFNSLKEYAEKNDDQLFVHGVYLDVDDRTRLERAKKRPGFDLDEWNRRAKDDDEKMSVDIAVANGCRVLGFGDTIVLCQTNKN